MRSKSWVIQVTVMSFVLGMLLAVSLKTQIKAKIAEGIPTSGPGVIDALRSARKQNADQSAQISSLQKKLHDLESQIAKGSSGSSALSKELQESRLKAGLTPVTGPGIIVTLKDSPQKDTSDAPPVDLIIHDTDIRAFISELVSAGAEAIAVNDHRITFRSSIRCVGPVVMVNGEPVAPPFEIKAIGDPRTLEGALRMPQGVVDGFPDSRMVDIRQQNHIEIPAFSESVPYKWAKPVS